MDLPPILHHPTPLPPPFHPLPPSLHAPPPPPQHLVEMEDEDGAHEGCRLAGSILVKRVAGRIHISIHQQILFQLLPQVRQGSGGQGSRWR